MALLALISLLYMANMLTITRVHYTVDIAGGLLFAFFMHKNVRKIVYHCDWLLSRPFVLGCKVKEYFQKRRKKVN